MSITLNERESICLTLNLVIAIIATHRKYYHGGILMVPIPIEIFWPEDGREKTF